MCTKLDLVLLKDTILLLLFKFFILLFILLFALDFFEFFSNAALLFILSVVDASKLEPFGCFSLDLTLYLHSFLPGFSLASKTFLFKPPNSFLRHFSSFCLTKSVKLSILLTRFFRMSLMILKSLSRRLFCSSSLFL